MKSILNSDFRYTNAANSAKPGYLARKFAAIRKQMEAEKAQREAAEKSDAQPGGKMQ